MNNRQAGAFRETIEREERAREKWLEANEGRYGPNGTVYGGTGTISQQSFNGNNDEPLTMTGHNAFSATGTIYDQAIRVSSPRLAEDDQSPEVPQTMRRKVIRQVEVPYKRQVKVPVKTKKIVPTQEQKKIRTTKLVEVPSFKEIDEQYTEVHQREAVREKEIWVKKIVPEKYVENYEVTKTRKVKVPSTEIKEVEDFEIVTVPGQKVVEVDGYRIDEVEDSKLVEVEEFQTYELRPHATGQAEVVNATEIGPVRQQHHSRTIGSSVFDANDARHRDIDEDSLAGDAANLSFHSQAPVYKRYDGSRPASRAARAAPPSRGRATASRASQRFLSRQAPPVSQRPLGLRVKDTNANGVVVARVNAGESAELAGIKTGDIVTYINNRPTRNLQEFRNVVGTSSGALLAKVVRRGGTKLTLTIHR